MPLPGETLTSALSRILACDYGLDATEFEAYLGRHDHVHDGEIIRTFVFTATRADPMQICLDARTAHCWADPADLPEQASQDLARLADIAMLAAAAAAGVLGSWRPIPFLFDVTQARLLLDAARGLARQLPGAAPGADLPDHLRVVLRPGTAGRGSLRGTMPRCGAAPRPGSHLARRCDASAGFGMGMFSTSRVSNPDSMVSSCWSDTCDRLPGRTYQGQPGCSAFAVHIPQPPLALPVDSSTGAPGRPYRQRCQDLAG